MATTAEAFRRIADFPRTDLVSEEDVKNKIVLPMLRALGYDDADFNYERRTGRGYVDVVVERFRMGIVVETKAPQKKPEDHIDQLESYVFEKHSRDRATIAMLTNGEKFIIYGVTEALWKGSLANFQLASFARSELGSQVLVEKLSLLLEKQRNEAGETLEVVTRLQDEAATKRERLQAIESELVNLSAERERVDARTKQLQAERASILGTGTTVSSTDRAPSSLLSSVSQQAHSFARVASPHILRLLEEKGAHSKEKAIQRGWLDEMLIGKVQGIANHQEVSFGIIELKKVGKEASRNNIYSLRGWMT